MPARLGSRCIAAAALIAVASSAPAVCVTDVQGFRDALDLATGSNSLTEIMVARGTYDLSATQLNFLSSTVDQGRVTIAGGYNQDCSTHINDPALTILDGGHQSKVLTLNGPGGFSVRYLTLRNGSYAYSTGLDITSAKEIIVDYNIIRDNSSTTGSFAMAIFETAGSTDDVHVDGNLLVGNTTVNSFAAGGVSTGGSGKIYVTNNTVADNTVPNHPGDCGGLAINAGASGTAYASNNIFWNNTPCDLSAAGVVLTNNDIGVIQGTIDPSSSGNLNVDPKFNPGAYSLAADSPLLGQGKLAPPGGLPTLDIEGHPRSFMGTVDIGAYERGDKIFNYNFDQ
jgi:hypothetical protein